MTCNPDKITYELKAHKGQESKRKQSPSVCRSVVPFAFSKAWSKGTADTKTTHHVQEKGTYSRDWLPCPLAWAPENAKPQRNLFSFPLMQLGLRKGKGPRVDATCMSLESFFYMQMGSWRQLNDPFSWRKPLSPMTSSVPTPNKDIWMITVHRSIVFVEFWRMVVHLKITN